MTQKVARINSRLYYDLFTKGGDKLISTFAILKTSRESDKFYAYTSRNKKFVGGFSLLRAKTNLTLHTIKKYVPTLIEMGLVNIESSGDVYVMGGEKIKTLYSSRKLVPILIGKNLNDTTDNSFSVRLFSAKTQQEREIIKKQNRSELLKQALNPTNPKLYRKAIKLLNKLNGEGITIVDAVVLSNQGYALLKNSVFNNKPMGGYWKRKLIKKGNIKSKRRFKRLEKMSYSTYLDYISFYPSRKLVYKNGFLCEEIVSTLEPLNKINLEVADIKVKEEVEPKKETVKALAHLSFDMIAWWQNN